MGAVKAMLIDALSAAPTEMLAEELNRRACMDGAGINTLSTQEILDELIRRIDRTDGLYYVNNATLETLLIHILDHAVK